MRNKNSIIRIKLTSVISKPLKSVVFNVIGPTITSSTYAEGTPSIPRIISQIGRPLRNLIKK